MAHDIGNPPFGHSGEMAIGDFIMDWMDKYDHINVKTSGSTGNSKIIKIYKQAMVSSALRTGDFFNVKIGDSALHCLPADFIAGKMMLVRAMILGLSLEFWLVGRTWLWML